MIQSLAAVLALALALGAAAAEDPLATHRDGSTKLATEQDELTADLRQLILEQTIDKVIELLEEVGEAMEDATDRLEGHDTGGETIAAQTDVIEKIYEAAKERQQQQGSDGSAMMDMLERMMGRTPDADKGGQGDQPGDSGGEGMTGESDTGNETEGGAAGGKTEERRVPKASGTAGRAVPAEFRDALEAFNRGAGEIAK